jgi:DNA-binding CsgD family transcriptional regulator
MIPGLVVLYLLFIGLAAGGSLASFRLRQRYDLPFLRTYHVFVLVSFAYAAINFIGEVVAPAILSGPSESMARTFLIIDLITVPLLGGLFFLLFRWIERLLNRPFAPALRILFGIIEVLFLAVFLNAFISYFLRGITRASFFNFYFLNGIILALLVAAVLVLILSVPAGNDPERRRLARGLGIAYAVSFAILGLFLVLPRIALSRGSVIAGVLPAGFLFLVNLPALGHIRRSLRTWSPRLDRTSSEERSLDGLSRNAGVSDREKEIIRLVALGCDNREIGKKLFISPKTVKNHMTSIYAKTGARNRVQLANLLRRPENE